MVDSWPMVSSWGTRYFTLSILGRDFSWNIQQFQLTSDIILYCIYLFKSFNNYRNLWGELLFYILNCLNSLTETVSFFEAFVTEVSWASRTLIESWVSVSCIIIRGLKNAENSHFWKSIVLTSTWNNIDAHARQFKFSQYFIFTNGVFMKVENAWLK